MGYSSAMRKLIGLILGGVAALNGVALLAAEDCQTVSFDGQGSRVAIAQCFSDSSGALPGWLAGLGMVVVGVLIATFSLRS